MLSKKRRATAQDVQKALTEGKKIRSKHFTLFVLGKRGEEKTRCGIIVPKKLIRTNVERNGVRRYGYMLLEELYASLRHEVVVLSVGKQIDKKNAIKELQEVYL